MSVDLDDMAVQVKKYYDKVMATTFENGEQKYTDLNDWLAQQYPAQDAAKLQELENKLKDLYTKCLGVVGVADQSLSDVYPPYPTSGIMNMKLHIWKLGFTADSFIRGSTAAYNVMMVMEKDLRDGGKTEKYPIEVLPFVTGKTPGQEFRSRLWRPRANDDSKSCHVSDYGYNMIFDDNLSSCSFLSVD